MSTSLQRFRWVALLLIAGLICSTCVTVAVPTAAVAATHPLSASASIPKGVEPWDPKTDNNIYTVPEELGSKKENEVLIHTLAKSFAAAPEGAMIRTTTYGSSDTTVINLLREAYKRGVNVRYTTWDDDYRANKDQLDKLKKVLGTNLKAASYFKVCTDSCYLKGKDEGTQHAKIILVSSVINTKGKRVKYISFVTSANFSNASAERTWNQAQLIVGHKKLYNALKSYVDGMRFEKKTKRNFAPVTDKEYKLYLYPSKKAVNPVYTALKQVKCSAKKGYGAKGKTKIRVTMFLWTKPQIKVATLLAKLKGKKCNVGAVISSGTTSKRVIKILRKAGVKLYDARVDGNYLHAKMTAVSGTVGGKSVNMTWKGSFNFTKPAMTQNTETLVRTSGRGQTEAAFEFFNRVAKHSRKL